MANLKNKAHRKELEEAGNGSCYCCISTFPVEDIREYIDAGETVLCPLCGVDSVLPGIIDTQTLEELESKWFGLRCL